MVGSSTASLHSTTISSHMLAQAWAATSDWPLLRPVWPLALLWEAEVRTLYHQLMICADTQAGRSAGVTTTQPQALTHTSRRSEAPVPPGTHWDPGLTRQETPLTGHSALDVPETAARPPAHVTPAHRLVSTCNDGETRVDVWTEPLV